MASRWVGCLLCIGTLTWATDDGGRAAQMLHVSAFCTSPSTSAPVRELQLSTVPAACCARQRQMPARIRAAGSSRRFCEPPLSGGQAEALFSKDAVVADADDELQALAGGFSTSLAKGYKSGDPRGNQGTSLSAPPPPPPPTPSQFTKPAAHESMASFQVSSSAATQEGKKNGGNMVNHWTIAQAEEFQYSNSQLGPSSCAPAAVLSSLNMIRQLPKDVSSRISLTDGLLRLVRHRACSCRHESITLDSECEIPLQQYLLSRGACGGGGTVAMMDVVEAACPDVVGAAVNIGSTSPFAQGALLEWIARWMQDGAAVTLTMNRQSMWEFEKRRGLNTKRSMPDAWHAQAVIGVDLQKRQVVLSNPIKRLSEAQLEATLPSAASLRVRGNEVLLHARAVDSDKIQEYNWPSPAWREQAVSEQVLLLRKHFPGELWVEANKAYLTIPYSGTGNSVGPLARIFAPRDSPAGKRILESRDPDTYTLPV